MHIKLTNGIPEIYSIGQLRRDNPNISFPKIISDDTLSRFNVYTYVVADRPSYDKATQRIEHSSFDNSSGSWVLTWVTVAKTPAELEEYTATMVSKVKAEARRRILTILPEWKQRNLTARAAELSIKGVTNWTSEEQLEYDNGQELWNEIKVLREKSNILEALSPIPENYSDDSYWG